MKWLSQRCMGPMENLILETLKCDFQCSEQSSTDYFTKRQSFCAVEARILCFHDRFLHFHYIFCRRQSKFSKNMVEDWSYLKCFVENPGDLHAYVAVVLLLLEWMHYSKSQLVKSPNNTYVIIIRTNLELGTTQICGELHTAYLTNQHTLQPGYLLSRISKEFFF